jgi:excisionase family DNA binding protein
MKSPVPRASEVERTGIAADPHLAKLAVTLNEAAERLSMSRDSFNRHVRPHLRLLRIGGLVLVPTSELRAYVERIARHTLETEEEP